MASAQAGTFRVLLTVRVRPGTEAEFERAWEEGSKEVTAQSGNLGHTLARSAQEESVYFVVSDWTDRDSFLAFEKSPEHIAHREKLHPFRAGGSLAMMHLVRGV
ncbi:antibiotic biosynthesis monooxygenase family protein [Streptomyces cinerochromogenes]|uniref:antibiotic biosynthesis monooxygenase family protein n=1 Tax=Streptomyces cinerochromogenes TaxID=66422 RepID=UPI00166F8D2C|nr:antibiotic biosynthesis monooxygenase family protein [Streptomyces cinerochromogenes]GGS91684.1 antibiotic biosynthesis monooxygenase [Streptomyces cinerochromogenes]